jgi:dTDP-3-amino-3,4,6-trideoxy-alpha-D-glucose transaminase
MIPQADPKRRFDAVRDEIMRAIQRVFDRGRFILGPETDAFEREFAEAAGAAHAVGVGSGTEAVAIALLAAGLPPGAEVVTVSLTAVATAAAIERARGVPRFVDIEPASRCMDPAALADAIGPRTAAVVPVHLHGVPAPMDKIMAVAARHSLLVIEDSAQAHGATYNGRPVGSFGHAAAFSFYPTKNLGAPGDAGAVVTADAAIAERARRMRNYGWDERRIARGPGANGRIDELQAAVLRVLLPYLPAQTAARRDIAGRYRDGLCGLPLELPPMDPGAVYHQFAIALEGRDRLRTHLAARGIGSDVHYPRGVHQEPRFAEGAPRLPRTEELVQRLLSLPIQPEVAGPETAGIIAAIAEGCGMSPDRLGKP